ARHRDPHSFPTRRSSDLHRPHWSVLTIDCGGAYVWGGLRLSDRGREKDRAGAKNRVCRGGRFGRGSAKAIHLLRLKAQVAAASRSEEHTSELQLRVDLVC